jgi:hypothetical protein
MAEKNGLADFKKLLAPGGLPELGPGPRAGTLPHAALNEALDPLLGNASLPPISRNLVRALILLWHDQMDAAHEIAQAIENADGSFVHGILHRREPDYGNAAYWFRRVGRHECFPQIASRVTELLKSKNERRDELLPKGAWDPFAFIDLCERMAGKPPSNVQVALLREIQGIESKVLLEHFLDS